MKVQFISTEFFTNEKKRTVTCKMVARLNESVNGQDNIRLTYDGEGRFASNFEVVTVAYCHQDDKFDETIGRRIAESKAKRLVFSEGRARAEKLERAISVYLSEVTKLKNSMETFKEKEVKHTEKLMSEVEHQIN